MALSEQNWLTLRAVIDRIVPADDWPSASEAGVIEFFRRLLPEQGLEARYAEGLSSLEASAQDAHGRSFGALEPLDQDALLLASPFTEVVAVQTIEGYYADPGNGGNRDGIAWQMVGFRVTA